MSTHALSGRRVEDITIAALARGDLGGDDTRIHPDTLLRQAKVAEEHGNPQLADNLRRAAELATIDDSELLAVYAALRPHRSTAQQLRQIAERLERLDAPRCAALVREALEVYESRGLLA